MGAERRRVDRLGIAGASVMLADFVAAFAAGLWVANSLGVETATITGFALHLGLAFAIAATAFAICATSSSRRLLTARAWPGAGRSSIARRSASLALMDILGVVIASSVALRVTQVLHLRTEKPAGVGALALTAVGYAAFTTALLVARWAAIAVADDLAARRLARRRRAGEGSHMPATVAASMAGEPAPGEPAPGEPAPGEPAPGEPPVLEGELALSAAPAAATDGVVAPVAPVEPAYGVIMP